MDVRKRRVIKNKKKTFLRLALLFLILCVMVAGALAAIVLLKKEAVAESLLTQKRFQSADPHIYTGSGFLYVHDEKLCNEDLYAADKSYEIPIDTKNSDYNLSGSPNIQLFYNSGALKIIGTDFPVEFSGTLLDVKCSANYVAVLRGDATQAESIQIFDKNGVKYDQIADTAQFIVDYGFYQAENEYLYVLSMSSNSSMPVCTITIYNLTNKTMTAVKQVQSQLIEQMHFTKTGMFAVGTNQIIRYEIADNRESYRVTVYGYQILDFDPSNSSFLLRPRSGGTLGTIKVLKLNDGAVSGEVQLIMQLPTGAISAFLMKGKLIAVTPSGYIEYNMKGVQTAQYRFLSNVEAAQKLDENHLLLRAGENLYTARIG